MSIFQSSNADINRIIADCNRSLSYLLNSSKTTNQCSISKAHLKKINDHIKQYCRSLLRVAAASKQPENKQRGLARKVIWGSMAAHVCAILRAAAKREIQLSSDEIIPAARNNKRWPVLDETITVHWERKSSWGYRLIQKDGLLRTAQRLVLRDMLQVLGIHSEYDYSRASRGEKKLFTHICKLIEEEKYHSWWTADVKSCFASLRPKHFDWLPLTGHEVRNFVFNPASATVKVLLPKDLDEVIQWMKEQYPACTVDTIDDMVSVTTQMVRWGGLPEGAVHSPLLACGFVGRELRACLGEKEGISGVSFMDDLAIGARLEMDTQAAAMELRQRMLSHPAGPLKLHAGPVQSVWSMKVCVLGYFLEPENGLNGTTHVKPGPKRLRRFKDRLKQRLELAGPQDDLLVIGEQYLKPWYASQQAWTKSPDTENLSWSAMASYVRDFEYGIEMGKNHPSYYELVK